MKRIWNCFDSIKSIDRKKLVQNTERLPKIRKIKLFPNSFRKIKNSLQTPTSKISKNRFWMSFKQ